MWGGLKQVSGPNGGPGGIMGEWPLGGRIIGGSGPFSGGNGPPIGWGA